MSILKRKRTCLLVLLVLIVHATASAASRDEMAAHAVGTGEDHKGSTLKETRLVHAPFFLETIKWAEAGIFWFGRVDPPGSAGQNYADVRVAYTADKLVIYVNVEDYYIWYNEEATPSSDLTRYDGVTVYLDTAHDGAATAQLDDYYFLSGLCVHGCGDGSNHRREAHGTGGGWDTSWHGNWSDRTYASWSCNPGPNSNECGIDFGWWSYIHIPWETVGLSGPPAQGTTWGLGVQLHDRDDQPPAGSVPVEYWPETFSAHSPSSWGELTFGWATYTPPPAVREGTTVIRRGLGDSVVVEDAWVGGGGGCSGGHEGDPEHDNYGGDTGLYVANQSLIADFPCFSKSFLRFGLDGIPAGKTIIAAKLTLHHWGNSGGGEWDPPQPSLIWLFSVDNDWQEYGITWNNAPLARENLTATWVDPLTAFHGWPGVAYEWDATEAVVDAYAAGQPLNLALYTADTEFHSSKYFSSSDTGDWNAQARPTLEVTWGEPLATVRKKVWPMALTEGRNVTYTLSLLGNGRSLTLTDNLPTQVSAPGLIQTLPSDPAAEYLSGTHRLTWTGTPSFGQPVTITFPVTVQVTGTLAIFNTAVLTDSDGNVSTSTTCFISEPQQVWLPLVLRSN